MISEIVTASDVDDKTKSRMDSNITVLEQALGTCERIFKNPVSLGPYNY